MSLLIWLTAAAAALVGFGLGWLLRGQPPGGRESADWRTRVAARDRDLHNTRQELVEVTIALQNARAESSDPVLEPLVVDLAEEPARSGANGARLTAAEVTEAADQDLRDMEVWDSGTGSPDLLHRIEELEVELAMLASNRCPNPGAHVANIAATASTTGPKRERKASPRRD